MTTSNMTVAALLFYSLAGVAQQPAKPNDAQIAGIEISANSEQIENAQIAKEKTTNTAIKRYALTLLNERGAANRTTGELASSLQITPEENESTKAIKNLTKKNRAKLKRLKGVKFDKAYVNSEIELQQMMVEMIKNSLIPAASDPNLVSLLKNELPLVEAHLKQARAIQSQLK